MKILKEGDKSRLDPVFRFECEKCGCVFEANRSECTSKYHMLDGSGIIQLCECPVCKCNVEGSLKR